MNSRERILSVFQRDKPDRVPLFEAWIESEIVSKLGRDTYIAREKLGIDSLPLGSYPKNTNAYRHGKDEWGRIFKNGHFAGGMIESYSDLEKYTPPISHAQDWFSNKQIMKVKKNYGEEYAFNFAWHDCSLGLTYMRMGFVNFFSSLFENPELVRAVIEKSTDWIIALVEQANPIVDFIILGDDAADNSRPLISPKMFREFILPEYKRIIKKSCVPILWHSDGNIQPLIPMIIEAGFSGIHSLEPKANIDLGKVKESYGDKLILAGNLDTTEVLCQSDLQLVRKDVARCIKQGAPGGGYFFSSSNSLFEGHKVESILEAYRYAMKIGNYPITI
ncbi:MAG: uroporphyrinogen decarboxylase family protein [Candidatus Hodarchaeales archaeon]